MKKTITIALMMMTLIALSAGSLYVGAAGSAGVNGVIRGENYKGYVYPSSSAYRLSVPVLYEFNDWGAVEGGVALSGKNYGLEKGVNGLTVQDLKMNNIFVEVPLLMRFTTPPYEGFALFASVGGYLGYWAWGREKGKSLGLADTSEAVAVDSKIDLSLKNRFEAGLEAALGCTVDFSRLRVEFFFDYAFALTDMNRSQEKGGYPLHNSTFTLGCGLMWRCI